MSATDRQNKLLKAEDWKTIYQSFKYADFKSYDFDNLRRTMIDYIRQNYPEDFNDYIESSEYLALIDLIAFLGQNISFRVDLNARENFLELAERRESVLRLARLVSYNPQRNRSANGLLKFTSVNTTENVIDSNGTNLSSRTIVWNDNLNPDWYEQFIKVLNSALPSANKFGTPEQLEFVSGVPTEQYRFNSASQGVPIYTFSKAVNSRNLNFEVVSTAIADGTIVEEAPNPLNQLGFLYRDNGQGSGSNTTGFFLHFREGSLQRGDFSIDSAVPNQKIDIDVSNINQTDVWLYELDLNGNERTLWSKVDAVEGNNIIYNSLDKKIRNIHSVLTRVDDRISLVFSDGVFGNLPKGNFRVYYRIGTNKNYRILPASVSNITVRIPYISSIGRSETLTLTLDLKVAVDNAATSESTDSIKTNAPATYYTQNRLITAEDYNVGPLSISQDIIKTRAVNRTASGISRYYDLLDATGKYSKTNLFGTDGILYKQYQDQKTTFSFTTRTDIEQVVVNKILPIIQDTSVQHYYLDRFSEIDFSDLSLAWSNYSTSTNQSTGVFKEISVVEQEIASSTKNNNSIFYQLGSFTAGTLRFIEAGSLVKFVAPSGQCFDSKNNLVLRNPVQRGDRFYVWTKVINVLNDGTEITNNVGPVIFNDKIPSGAILKSVKPKLVSDFLTSVKNQVVAQSFGYKTFGLRYDTESRSWRVIIDENLNVFDTFSTAQTGDESSQKLDRSWLLLFETDGISYTVTYRTLRYVFESNEEVKFYYDGYNKVYDTKTGEMVKDKIKILSINSSVNSNEAFTTDFDWEIYNDFRDTSGYVNSKKLEVTFFDSDDDGIIDNPDLFTDIVGNDSYIFTKKIIQNGTEEEIYVDQTEYNIVIDPSLLYTQYTNGTIFYFTNDDVFKILDRATLLTNETFDYSAYIGRSNIKFQYTHITSQNKRIDPSSTNIVDVYLLTRQYDTAYRQYIENITTVKPLPPSSDSLYLNFSEEINKIKSISDEIIYHPVAYKPLFGNKSEPDLQAVFKVVKNSERVISDNEIKSRVIGSINKFFALDNWSFGETFYFSELSAFIMNELAPDLNSVVIVPRSASKSFGSLFELNCESNEIFISSATVDNVELITANTADRLRSEGAIVTTSALSNTGIQSSAGIADNSTTGGFTY